MSYGKTQDRLKSLQAKRGKLEAQIQKLAAVDLARKRKQELQRKILVGGYYLELATKDGRLDELNSTMLTWLSREADRKLFQTGA